MKYAWVWIPTVIGFVYYFWSAKDPDLDEKLSFLNPIFTFIGYAIGIGVILVLLWGVSQ